MKARVAHSRKTTNGETMRITKTLLVAALVALATPAFADQDNLDRAVSDALSTYRSGGEHDLATKAELCSTGIDFRGAVSRASEVEYCMALEAAGVVILQHDGKLAQSQYFEPTDVLIRASANLVRARVIRLPEDANPYMQPRMRYVREKVLKSL